MPTTESVSSNHPAVAIACLANVGLALYFVIRILIYMLIPSASGADLMIMMIFMIPVGVSFRACYDDSSRLRRLLAQLLNLIFLLIAIKTMFPAKQVLEPVRLWTSVPFALVFLLNVLLLGKKDIVQVRILEDEDAADTGTASTRQERREHHWAMTRVVLPGLLQDKAADSFVASLRQDGTAVFTRLWIDYGKNNISDAAHIVPYRGIAVYVDETVTGTELITIQMPQAIATGECYFMAIVRTSPASSYQTFSLEYSVLPRGGKPFTMLTGIHGGNRCNYGLGSAPDKDAFVVAVTALLEKPTPAMTTMKVPAL